MDKNVKTIELTSDFGQTKKYTKDEYVEIWTDQTKKMYRLIDMRNETEYETLQMYIRWTAKIAEKRFYEIYNDQNK